jgi:hypothetical protein
VRAEANAADSEDICHNDHKIFPGTRLLIYHSFLDALAEVSEKYWQYVVNRYSTLAYLACMETNGRPVAIVTHKRESSHRSAKYGYNVSALFEHLTYFQKLGWKNRWYDDTTNFGVFQISADTLLSDSASTRAVKAVIARYQGYARKSKDELAKRCFTKEMYYGDPYDTRAPLQKNVLAALSYQGAKPQYAKSLKDWQVRMKSVQSFAVANILCPRMNLEIAKVLVHLRPHYFGPNIASDGGRCGRRAKTCRATLNEIIRLGRGFAVDNSKNLVSN